MRISLISLLAYIGGFVFSVICTPTSSNTRSELAHYSDITKLTFETLKYVGPTTPGGPDVELWGTAEEVYHQIMAINPAFRIQDFPSYNSTLEDNSLHPRGRLPPRCNVYNLAIYSHIGDGYYYLKQLPGTCNVGAGWGTCTRLSCSYSSGIYLCNDNRYPIAPTCSYMALYVQDVLKGCPQDSSSGIGKIRGQTFDTDNYNIIVTAPSAFGQSC